MSGEQPIKTHDLEESEVGYNMNHPSRPSAPRSRVFSPNVPAFVPTNSASTTTASARVSTTTASAPAFSPTATASALVPTTVSDDDDESATCSSFAAPFSDYIRDLKGELCVGDVNHSKRSTSFMLKQCTRTKFSKFIECIKANMAMKRSYAGKFLLSQRDCHSDENHYTVMTRDQEMLLIGICVMAFNIKKCSIMVFLTVTDNFVCLVRPLADKLEMGDFGLTKKSGGDNNCGNPSDKPENFTFRLNAFSDFAKLGEMIGRPFNKPPTEDELLPLVDEYFEQQKISLVQGRGRSPSPRRSSYGQQSQRPHQQPQLQRPQQQRPQQPQQQQPQQQQQQSRGRPTQQQQPRGRPTQQYQ